MLSLLTCIKFCRTCPNSSSAATAMLMLTTHYKFILTDFFNTCCLKSIIMQRENRVDEANKKKKIRIHACRSMGDTVTPTLTPNTHNDGL